MENPDSVIIVLNSIWAFRWGIGDFLVRVATECKFDVAIGIDRIVKRSWPILRTDRSSHAAPIHIGISSFQPWYHPAQTLNGSRECTTVIVRFRFVAIMRRDSRDSLKCVPMDSASVKRFNAYILFVRVRIEPKRIPLEMEIRLKRRINPSNKRQRGGVLFANNARFKENR